MGGNQSWLACDRTYPSPGRPARKESETGNLALAVLVFVLTMVALLLGVTAAHCIAIWRRQRQLARRSHASPGSDDSNYSDSSSTDNVAASMQQQQQHTHQQASWEPPGGVENAGYSGRPVVTPSFISGS